MILRDSTGILRDFKIKNVPTQQIPQQRVQTQQYVGPGQVTPRWMPPIPPVPPVYNGPKLGIEAYGKGSYIEVTRALPGTPAARLGLEPGDRILQINGLPVRSIPELQHLLQNSVYSHSGQIRVLIDNVRARHGHWGAQRFVSATTYLDGYAHLAGNLPGAGPVITTQPTPTVQPPVVTHTYQK